MSLVEDKFPVTYNTEREFVVHTDNAHEIRFSRMKNDLRGCDIATIMKILNKIEREKRTLIIDTVKDR